MEIKIKEYEQAPGNVSIGGIKWQKKWDVCITCDTRKEAEALKTRLAQPEPYKQPEDNRVLMKAYRAIHEKQPEPEPVGWLCWEDKENNLLADTVLSDKACTECFPVYTAPPKREWVGLTDNEYEAMAEQYVTNCYFDTLEYAKDIEAKLKEKNT